MCILVYKVCAFSFKGSLIFWLVLNSSTIDKLGEWCLERRMRPRIKPSRMRRVSMTTLWAAATHLAPSHWQVSGNTNTYHILTKARGRGGPGMNSEFELSDKINKHKSLDIQSRAVSHVGPLNKTPGHPAPEPWEILLASIVLRLT